MSKPRPRPDHLMAALVPDLRPVGSTPARDEHAELLRQIAESPACELIRDWATNAMALGLDVTDPDTIRRCIAAGEAEFERLEAAGERVATYKALLAERRKFEAHAPVVYYMRLGELVKIGLTRNIGSRFAALNAQGVMAVEPGDSDVENDRHRQFGGSRSHLEYFHLTPELAAHIVTVRDRFEGEMGMTTEAWLATRIQKRRTSA